MPQAEVLGPFTQYGGLTGVPKTQRDRKAAAFAAVAAASRGFVAGLLGGLGVFLLALSACAFGLFYHPNVVVALLAGLASACAACLVLGRRPGAAPYLLPLGASTAAALACGVPLGIATYMEYGALVYFYAYSRTYHNVVPSEKAAAMADAGRIVFSSEARIDQDRAVGYAADDDRRYCVAPIVGSSESSLVEFWAVGRDCCAWQGGFTCDSAAAKSGSGGAVLHGGAVVFGESRIFDASIRDRYHDARRKAEAMSRLSSGESPLFVRWIAVDELERLPEKYTMKACLFIALASVGYVGLSVAFLWNLARPPSPPRLPA